MLTLQRKFIIYLAMVFAAPLYVLVRYFYGKAFYRVVIVALAVNLIVLPFTLQAIEAESGLRLHGSFYAQHVSLNVAILAIYAAPLHIYWYVFQWFSGDTRYDLDNPGRPPVPVHPWLIDVPAACALPLYLFYMQSNQVRYGVTNLWLPTFVREFAPEELKSVVFFASDLHPAIGMSCAYLLVCYLTTPAPKWNSRRRLKLTTDKPVFDLAQLADVPNLKRDNLQRIMAQRSPELQQLTASKK